MRNRDFRESGTSRWRGTSSAQRQPDGSNSPLSGESTVVNTLQRVQLDHIRTRLRADADVFHRPLRRSGDGETRRAQRISFRFNKLRG